MASSCRAIVAYAVTRYLAPLRVLPKGGPAAVAAHLPGKGINALVYRSFRHAWPKRGHVSEESMRLSAVWILLAAVGLSSFASAQENKIERSRLPPLVERSVAALAENATVRGFSHEIEQGITYYEVDLTVAGHRKDFLMDIRGNVVEVEEEVALESLSVSVKNGLQAVACDGNVQTVESISKHGKLVAYEAHVVKDGKRSEVQVGPEGEPLNHEE